MNKNYIIGGALIVGGGLYYAYTKGLLDKFIKPKPKGETAKEESQTTIDEIKQEQKEVVKENKVVNKQQAILEGAKLAYKRSVETLQGLLKVGTDGDAGRTANSQTNKALAATYGLDKGIVSPLNVLYYIKRVENKDTLVARSLAAKKVAAVKNKVVNDAKTFLNFVNNKGLKARLLENVTANKFQFDKVRGIFIDMKSSRNFSKGTTFSKGDFTSQTRGAYILFRDGAFVYALDPSKFIVN
jgi:hypothetical protein